MVKVGFIDYYLDEWHANNYPKLLKDNSGGRYIVSCAYGLIDSPSGDTNKKWSEKNNIPLCSSIDELVEKCDCIIVLSPDNPEMHLKLSEKALLSGKRVYIDKTFSIKKSEAEKIFELAEKGHSVCWSSSALGFATELSAVDKKSIDSVYIEGPENFEVGAVHLAEQAAVLVEGNPKRVMAVNRENHPSLAVEFDSGVVAHLIHRNDDIYTYAFTPCDKDNNAVRYVIKSDFFKAFINAVIDFFDTGKIPVSHEQTLNVVSIIEAGEKALNKPFEWVYID